MGYFREKRQGEVGQKGRAEIARFRLAGRHCGLWAGQEWGRIGAVSQRERDSEYIDRMLRRLEEASEQGEELLILAARAAGPLLERRAKLLGLDATQNEQPPGESVLQRMQREIAAQGNGAAKS